jgi:NAD(P)-dependent dehydrogenase (short-subunit alcohol dehydrogenase family)
MAVRRVEDIGEDVIRHYEQYLWLHVHGQSRTAAPLKRRASIINTGSIRIGLVGNPLSFRLRHKARSHFHQTGTEPGEAQHPGQFDDFSPVWTPTFRTMPEDEIENFGHEVALGRPGQPEELTPTYVLLASSDGNFMTSALVEVTGGKDVDG